MKILETSPKATVANIFFICQGLMLIADVVTASRFQCEADHHCTLQQFCSDNGHCTECVSCAFYKRAASTKSTCAHLALDCGDCLPGFQEESFSHSKRLFCTAKPIQENTDNPHGALNISLVALIVFAVVGIGTIIVGTGLVWLRRKRISRPTITTPVEDAEENPDHIQPPAYEEISENEAPLLTTDDVNRVPQQDYSTCNESEKNFSCQVQEKSEQPLTQARPYRRAQKPYDNCQVDDEDSATSELGYEENHRSPSAPDLNDEETMESTWTYHQSPSVSDANNEETVQHFRTYHNVDEPTPDNIRVTQDGNDSGVSMPSSHGTSTGSLASPMGPTIEGTILFQVACSFSECFGPAFERDARNRRQQSPESLDLVPMKRARLNSRSMGSIASNESRHPGASMNHAMDSGLSMPSSNDTSHTSLPDPVQSRLMNGSRTIMVRSSSAATGISAVPAIEQVSIHLPTVRRPEIRVEQCEGEEEIGNNT